MSKSDNGYDKELAELQLALVRFQLHAREAGEKALVIFEGRDAAGKDGAIKRLVERLSVRHTRVVALPKPSDREQSQWYFQRYLPHLPAGSELVLFNRSWYNRGGVEPVMGFCTDEEHERFLRDVPILEEMLAGSDIRLVKFWLDISKKEQAKRLKDRQEDPLAALKVSALDEAAQAKWDQYSEARDEMLRRTHTPIAPWICVRTDDKKTARLNVLRHLVQTLAPAKIARKISPPDPEVLFPFELSALTDGRLER